MIDWNTVIATIITSSSISAFVLAGLVFVAKSIFNQLLAHDIEKYRADREIESERFKAELQRASFEHQTRYQNLHIKRAEVIADLYRLLVEAEHDSVSLANPAEVAGEPTKNEKKFQAYKSGKALYDFFEHNRIYFKQESCERIGSFINGLYHALSEFNIALYALDKPNSSGVTIEHWIKAWEKLTKELPPIKADIEKEFREILGL